MEKLLHRERIPVVVDDHGLCRTHGTGENCVAQRAFHVPFQVTLDRPRAEFRLVSAVGNGIERLVGQGQLQILTGGAFGESLEFEPYDVTNLRLRQALEYQHFV